MDAKQLNVHLLPTYIVEWNIVGFQPQKADRNVDGGIIHSEQSFKFKYTRVAYNGQVPLAPSILPIHGWGLEMNWATKLVDTPESTSRSSHSEYD